MTFVCHSLQAASGRLTHSFIESSKAFTHLPPPQLSGSQAQSRPAGLLVKAVCVLSTWVPSVLSNVLASLNQDTLSPQTFPGPLRHGKCCPYNPRWPPPPVLLNAPLLPAPCSPPTGAPPGLQHLYSRPTRAELLFPDLPALRGAPAHLTLHPQPWSAPVGDVPPISLGPVGA